MSCFGHKKYDRATLGCLLMRKLNLLNRYLPLLFRRLATKGHWQDIAMQCSAFDNLREDNGVTGIRFLVRVDDFPSWDVNSQLIQDFHEVLTFYNVPYLLGVTPFLADDPLNPAGRKNREMTGAEVVLLKQMCLDGVEIALHGFTHRTRETGFHSELVGLTDLEFKMWLEKSLDNLRTRYLPAPIAFIPPFNTIDFKDTKLLADYLPILCGGPESILCLGLYGCPSNLNGIAYWPSFFPAYGRASDLISFAQSKIKQNHPWIVPLTLHWRWEIKDHFAAVRRLASIIDGRVIRWSEIIGIFQQGKNYEQTEYRKGLF